MFLVRRLRLVWIPTVALMLPATGCRTAPATVSLAPTAAARSEVGELDHNAEHPLEARTRIPGLARPEMGPAAATGIQQVEATEPALPGPVTEFGAAPGLTVFDAMATALSQNPDLITQRQAERVSRGALGLAQTYPFNPYVQIQATPYQDKRDDTSGTTYHYVLVMQQIQLAHQQAYRENVACAQLNSVRWTILQAQLVTIAQAERLYFMALYQKGLTDLARITARNNDELLRILEKRLEGGEATGADVAMVRLDARSTRQQLLLAEANLATSLLDLQRHLGLPPTASLPLATELDEFPWRPLAGGGWPEANSSIPPADPDGSGLVATDVLGEATRRPDVLAARSDIDAARAGTDLAGALRIPDLQLGPYYQRNDSGTTFWGFRAHMDIPVWNSGTPLLRLREAELQQRVMAWRQLERRAGLEAEAAVDRYNRAFRLLMSFEGNPEGPFPVELQKLEEQFIAGEVDILRVFQARNSLIQNRRAQLDSLNEIAQAAAAVTAATGLPLESLLDGTRAQ